MWMLVKVHAERKESGKVTRECGMYGCRTYLPTSVPRVNHRIVIIFTFVAVWRILRADVSVGRDRSEPGKGAISCYWFAVESTLQTRSVSRFLLVANSSGLSDRRAPVCLGLLAATRHDWTTVLFLLPVINSRTRTSLCPANTSSHPCISTVFVQLTPVRCVDRQTGGQTDRQQKTPISVKNCPGVN